MKSLKMLGLATIAAVALTASTAGSASATTLHVNGVTQNKAVTIEASTKPEGGVTWLRTDLSVANTCTESKVKGTTSVFTGTKVTGALSTLTFKSCTNEAVVVDAAGQIYVEHESGTTSGNVFSENTEVTVPTSFGFSVTCKTGAGTKIGTLVGVASGNATLNINAVLNCGFLLPSAIWGGVYQITSPSGLGVSA